MDAATAETNMLMGVSVCVAMESRMTAAATALSRTLKTHMPAVQRGTSSLFQQQGGGCHCSAVLPGVTRVPATEPAASAALETSLIEVELSDPTACCSIISSRVCSCQLRTGVGASLL